MTSILKGKKFLTLLALTLCLSLSAGIAIADNHKGGGFSGPAAQGGGFSGPGPKVFTLKEAVKQADDTWVTLKGNILRHEGSDKYVFRDASGEGIVEIDDDAWNGLHIGPNDLVELVTKVDKDWNHTELEAKMVRKVQ